MNEVMAQLTARTSTRAFTDEPISERDERAILEAACQAPTAGNQQLYSIIVARDPALKAALAHTCDDQPFIARAPLVLVFCIDVRRWWRGFGLVGADPRDPGVGDALLALEDVMCAAQNAVVAAGSLGIGSCYIGDILERRERQASLLGCPRYVVPAAMLVMGHPTPGQLARRKPRRFELEGVVFENRYQDLSDEDLRALLAQKEGHTADPDDGFEAWLAAFCRRKWNSGFSREMSASVARTLADFTYAANGTLEEPAATADATPDAAGEGKAR